jgi:hypothetical protein
MREDQRSDRQQPEDETEDRFDDALDDLFGPDEPGPQRAREAPAEPAPTPAEDEIPQLIDVLEQRAQQVGERQLIDVLEQRTQQLDEQHVLGPGGEPPATHGGVERRPAEERGRSWRRIACLGCVTFAGVVAACLAALLVIGLVVGDDESEPTVVGQFVDVESSTNTGAQPSPTAVLTGLPLLERAIMGERRAATIEVDGEPGYGTLEKPAPVGAEAALGDGWLLRIDAFDADAEQAVLDENEFNEPAGEGRHYVMATVTATNDTGLTAYFSATFRLRLLGLESETVYMTFESEQFCGVVPDPVEETEILPGASVSGNVCWIIDERDVDSLVLFSEEFDASEYAIWFDVSSGGS